MRKERSLIVNGKKHTILATKRELKFWDLIYKGFSKKDAYIKAYPDSNPKYAATYASRLWDKTKFEEVKQNLWEQYKADAEEAYGIQKEIMRDNLTKPELKNQIADKIQDRAGFSPIVKTAQMKIKKDLDNPLEGKSDEELNELLKENTRESKKIRQELKQLSKGRQEVIEGEFSEND